MPNSSSRSWTRLATSLLRDLGGSILRGALGGRTDTRRGPAGSPRPPAPTTRTGTPAQPGRGSAYPGDYTGPIAATYSPTPDGQADPGEIVWAWIPYEEDHAQGKDRPALVIAEERPWLLALQVTSKDHDRDAAQEARAGRYWMDIGTGAWDRQGRPSEVRLNRVIRLDPAAVRREGAALDRAVFDRVVLEVARYR